MNHKIVLKFFRPHFEEIYFRDNQTSYFKNPIITDILHHLLISSFIISVALIYSIINENFIYFFLTCFPFSYFVYKYLEKVYEIFKWKKHVNRFLNETEKYSKNEVVLSDNYFSVIQDDKESIEKWNMINSCELNKDFITIVGNNNYILPKKSMSDEDFIILKKTISNKLKEESI